jgi:NADPH2:quinone reductase
MGSLAETTRHRAADIFRALHDGGLSIGIAGRYTLDTVPEARRNLENTTAVGKLIIKIE